MTIIAPLDTGFYTGGCLINRSHMPGPPGHETHGPKVNCSAWTPDGTGGSLGTLNNFDHLILANLGLFGQKNGSSVEEEARELLPRIFAPYDRVPNVTQSDVMKYWESNIVGNVFYPDGVKFIIASFPQLFGTEEGARTQRWCEKN